MGFFKEVEQIVVAEVKAPTLDDRFRVQSVASDAAVDLFYKAAARLEIAADELDAIATDSQAQADIHAKRAEDSADQAVRNRARAVKIRNLLD